MFESLTARLEPPLLLAACLALMVALSVWLARFLDQSVPASVVEKGEQARQTQRAGMGGWLAVYAFFVYTAPPLILFGAWQLQHTSFSPEAWLQASDLLFRQFLLAFDALSTGTNLAFSIALVVGFFRKHHRTPKLVLVEYGVSLPVTAVDTALQWLAEQTGNETNDWVRVIWIVVAIEAIVFIPYFVVSKRVAGTFVRDFSANPPDQ